MIYLKNSTHKKWKQFKSFHWLTKDCDKSIYVMKSHEIDRPVAIIFDYKQQECCNDTKLGKVDWTILFSTTVKKF